MVAGHHFEIDNDVVASTQGLSRHSLNLLNTYLHELVKEENLSHSAEVLLRRAAVPVCALAGDDEHFLSSKDHPARKIIDTIVKIAKAAGPAFTPGHALYQTVKESIDRMRSSETKNSLQTLHQILADLESVLKLAFIRIRADVRRDANNAGAISGAKIHAALIIHNHARRFNCDDTVLYFSLTNWFELIVMTLLQWGTGSTQAKSVDRLTFTFFYLACRYAGNKHERLLDYLLLKLDELIDSLAPTYRGNAADFYTLRDEIQRFVKLD